MSTHEHPDYLGHHFETPQQQYDSSKLSMWIFLATEIQLFSGLFCAYSVYRSNHPEIFVYAHQYLDKTLGGSNTLVLICSSLTMAWAVRCAPMNQRRGLILLLSMTLLFASCFLRIKYVEYERKWKHGLLWGKRFHPLRSPVQCDRAGRLAPLRHAVHRPRTHRHCAVPARADPRLLAGDERVI